MRKFNRHGWYDTGELVSGMTTVNFQRQSRFKTVRQSQRRNGEVSTAVEMRVAGVFPH